MGLPVGMDTPLAEAPVLDVIDREGDHGQRQIVVRKVSESSDLPGCRF